MKNERSMVSTIVINVLAALAAVIVATGIAALVFAIVAVWNGETVGSLYSQLFPRFRGAPEPAPITPAMYAIFVLYIVCAAEVSVIFRRRIAGRR